MPRELPTAKFGVLAMYDDQLIQVACLAERYFPDDPMTSVLKLRQLGGMLTRQATAETGLLGVEPVDQTALRGRLRRDGGHDRRAIDVFRNAAGSATRPSISTAATTSHHPSIRRRRHYREPPRLDRRCRKRNVRVGWETAMPDVPPPIGSG